MISLAGKVAVITGAGRGLGRSYALHLAERGVMVVVNDLGVALDGSGKDSSPAQQVVDEIRAKGGQAVANNSDVTSEAGAASIIAQAMESFGNLQIVINNAGICRDLPFEQTSLADFELNFRIHVAGHYNVSKAAWPILKDQQYGRVIMTGSGAGVFGLKNETAYSMAKGAIYGLTRTLALEGEEHGILVNAVLPGGVSRMHEEAFPDPAVLQMMRDFMPPELVAPAVAWLASENCNVSGQAWSVWAGRVSRLVVGSGAGYFNRALTAEEIDSNIAAITSADGLFEPRDGIDDAQHWQKILMGG
ncbi:MAG: SDR family NAD(P)-dependent oxidoreductase [Caulobacterales bacterium]